MACADFPLIISLFLTLKAFVFYFCRNLAACNILSHFTDED